ncbi:hypothetical protein [Paenibacillus camelliae]|uniref:hypothetical protein n=1 Tax=Paenibacillus camelliae TaxID=512410 RepID=UPI00203D6EBD|nr:hypothetical protein [Paenibacillus camelliae]MCM3632883.1 hypothetical protein [Paenibacillus camelliae]
MAIRNRLHVKHLDKFKDWLVKDGWKLEKANSMSFEVVRARKGKRVAVFYYTTRSEEHLSYEDKHNGIISQFLREVKANA